MVTFADGETDMRCGCAKDGFSDAGYDGEIVAGMTICVESYGAYGGI